MGDVDDKTATIIPLENNSESASAKALNPMSTLRSKF